MRSFKFPVEAGHIMLFARALGDDNPAYSDADYVANSEVGHLIAPPTFVQSSAQFDPEYVLRPRVGEQWFGSGKEPTGVERDPGASVEGTSLHAEQAFEYHRPLKPGEVLTVSIADGKAWTKQGRRGGTLTFKERITEYRTQVGDLVVTARSISVRTSKTVEA